MHASANAATKKVACTVLLIYVRARVIRNRLLGLLRKFRLLGGVALEVRQPPAVSLAFPTDLAIHGVKSLYSGAKLLLCCMQ